MSKCRSCGAAIVWAVTAAGKRMPLDPTTVVDGNVLLYEDGYCVVVASPPEPMPDDATLHVSHFATCPDAATHRKKT